MKFEKQKICIYWANLLLVMVTIGCHYQESHLQKDDAEPFDLKEPEEVASVTDERIPEPTIGEGGQVIYKPGEVPWVESSHRVVFHLMSEGIETTNQPKYDDVGTPDADIKYPIHLDGETYNRLRFRRFSRSYPDSQQIIQARNNGYVFTGFHWPEELRQDEEPTLHMFACPVNSGSKSVFYEVGDLVFECSFNKNKGYLHLPLKEPYQTWLDCEEARYIESYAPGNATGCASSEERQPSAYIYKILHWLGPNPQSNIISIDIHSRVYERKLVGTWIEPLPTGPTPSGLKPRHVDIGRE